MRTVWTDSRTPVTFWNSLRSHLAVRNGCRATKVWRWRSSLGTVALLRPPACLLEYCPCSLYLRITLVTTLELTPKETPIWRYVMPSSLIWTHLATSTSVKCLLTQVHSPKSTQNNKKWQNCDIFKMFRDRRLSVQFTATKNMPIMANRTNKNSMRVHKTSGV